MSALEHVALLQRTIIYCTIPTWTLTAIVTLDPRIQYFLLSEVNTAWVCYMYIHEGIYAKKYKCFFSKIKMSFFSSTLTYKIHSCHLYSELKNQWFLKQMSQFGLWLWSESKKEEIKRVRHVFKNCQHP